ncbi:hypothetical protein Tco_0231354 [Tanacetum coccineum]
MPVQTRRQLATDPDMCMFALTTKHLETKWLWKNKKDEDQTVIHNKARLVAKGYAWKQAQHKMEYESRVNERQPDQKQGKDDYESGLECLRLVIIESNGTESKEQDTSSRSGNDAHVDDADIRPIYDEEPKAELHKEKEHLKQTYKDLFDSIKRTRVQTKDQNDSLMAQLNKKSNENADVLAQIQKKGFAIAALKNELRKLTGNSVNTKFAKPSILGKPVGQPLKNQSVVRQPTAFKSERPRISKPRFASQVDVNNDLSKPVTTHHLPKRRESAPAKPHHMIATKLI